ncbi:alternative ribosome rescue aminoacyl-tRNA hydrolase ArfB [Bdellovibrio sp. SKB1291214]|uniref:alternative ribosome rescue aminoacyl-tRNA hydrolase ArfB n=1 Tax=Bdellovibrio sp. SKB1291214 TaxID=1732569 RepID=UPI0020CF6C7A|nr:alternative ribosome rescue aminoacyl-tRNA hydrolase ArfB [Bdellovibrio sp. SKB1291214]UYL07900.1 alternative ribosome rescue aminoacyl-tRNA hydrolase ArfB [Bdellovibrio sp. SKB1291214]
MIIDVAQFYHEFDFTYARSRGPGGQNVNRTNSAAILRWNVRDSQSLPEPIKLRLLEKLANQLTVDGDILIRSEEFRDQDQNRSACLKRLQALVQKALFVPKKRVATKPTRSSVRKRLDSKKRHSEVKAGRKKLY